MMQPREVVERYFAEFWNRRDFALADEIISPDCITHQLRSTDDGAPSASRRGPEALKAHVASWLAAFPDLIATVEESITDRDRVVSWVALRGTHEGPWFGVPPSGRRVLIRSVVMHRVEDGRIVEDWALTEALGLFQQLGIVRPTPRLLADAANRLPAPVDK